MSKYLIFNSYHAYYLLTNLITSLDSDMYNFIGLFKLSICSEKYQTNIALFSTTTCTFVMTITFEEETSQYTPLHHIQHTL